MDDLNNKNIIVCAGSTGIGEGVVSVLASYGANITTFSRNNEKIARLKKNIKLKTGNDINSIVGDLSKKEDLEKVVDSARSNYGDIYGLVMNYGDPKVDQFTNLKQSDWDYNIEMMLRSTINLTEFCSKDMIKNKNGKIVYITSMTTKNPLENFSISNTLRAGIVALGKTLSIEFGKYNINVNSISQGYFYTERLKNIIAKISENKNQEFDRVKQDFISQIPLGRFGKPEDAGNLVAFLCSEMSSYITGTNIQIDGGVVKSI